MIRVLQIVHGMNVGGIETFLMNIYRNIDREKVQFDFMVNVKDECAYDQEIKKLGGKIYYIPSRRESVKENKRKLDQFFKEHKEYQVVHAHLSSLSYIEPLKKATKYKVPTRIAHSRNNNQGGKLHYLLHKLHQPSFHKYVTDCFAISELAAKWLYGENVRKGEDYQIIGNGIEVENFIFNPEIRKQIRKELNLKEEIVIGHTGRFVDQKNHDFLIDIFYEICKKKAQYKLLLLGEGILRSSIEEKVKKLGLEEKVIFLGVKQNVYDYMQAMDVFLLPSIYEGLGRVLIEAQAADLPCVVSAKVIPEEAKILETYETVPLSWTSEKWADRVIKSAEYHERKNRLKEIQQAGYDIRSVAKELEKLYIDRSKGEQDV